MEKLLNSLQIKFTYDSVRSEFKCCCPFPEHNDNNPSFGINIEKNIWKCWSRCGGGQLGDLFNRFDEWVHADDFGLFEIEISDKLDKTIEKIMAIGIQEEVNVEYFHIPKSFLPIVENEFAQYMFDRGFTMDTLCTFDVKYTRYGKYGNRVILPVKDESGVTCSFSARSINGSQPKNLFPLGSKIGKMVFNIPPNYVGGDCFLCESVIDAMWMYQNGYTDALSTFSCNVTPKQFEMIMDKYDSVICCFDSDEAGLHGYKKLVEFCRKEECSYGLVTFPDGKDANECTPDEIQKVMSNIDYVEFRNHQDLTNQKLFDKLGI